jgi:hypothetical protein
LGKEFLPLQLILFEQVKKIQMFQEHMNVFNVRMKKILEQKISLFMDDPVDTLHRCNCA